MDYYLVRANERFKGWGQFLDNAALAFFIASVGNFFATTPNPYLIVAGILLGIAFLASAWQIRGLIQPEN